MYLAKLPMLPHRYLFEKMGKNIAIMEGEKDQPLLLLCDDEAFWDRYEEYYRQRFELEEMGEDFKVPAEYEVAFGKVRFDNEEQAEQVLEELE